MQDETDGARVVKNNKCVFKVALKITSAVSVGEQKWEP